MIRLGLTGSIGMGKTTTAGLFRDEGVPVYDADAAVHALYAPGGEGAPALRAAFPEAVRPDGSVDRTVLSARLQAKPGLLKVLEAAVHPLLAAGRRAFLEGSEAAGVPVVVLDVPLLFEAGGEGGVDAVVVVSADAAVQRERVLARPGMDEAKLALLLARQTPDAEKRRRARWVIDTGSGIEAARQAVHAVLADVLRPGWPAT